MMTKLATIVLFAMIAATEGLYCYHSADGGNVTMDARYAKCGASSCLKAALVEGPMNYQGCGNCSALANIFPFRCADCQDHHLCNGGQTVMSFVCIDTNVKMQTLDQLLATMNLSRAVLDQVRSARDLRIMLRKHIGMLALMQKRGMGRLLGKLLERSHHSLGSWLSLGQLFGMHSAMDILIEKPILLEKLADRPEKFRFVMLNPAEFEKKLKDLDKFEEWLEWE